jgi:hypothetical protein
MNKLKYITAVVIAVAGLGLQQAKAVPSVPFSVLSVGNSAISGFPGPYADVFISLSGQTATITFTSLSNGTNTFLMGDGSTVALDVNATSFTVGTVTGTQPAGFTAPTYSTNIGSQNVDGFGLFNFTVDSSDGYPSSSTSVTFTLTNTGSTNWLSASDVLAFNKKGFDAAAHIFVTTIPALASNTALATGFAGEPGNVFHTPDGGTTAMLLGAGLSALGLVRRFVKR